MKSRKGRIYIVKNKVKKFNRYFLPRIHIVAGIFILLIFLVDIFINRVGYAYAKNYLIISTSLMFIINGMDLIMEYDKICSYKMTLLSIILEVLCLVNLLFGTIIYFSLENIRDAFYLLFIVIVSYVLVDRTIKNIKKIQDDK